MPRYERRVHALTRRLGCSKHGSSLHCATCHAPEPIPEVLLLEGHALIASILARVDVEAARAACRRVPRPCHGACRCGASRHCGPCDVEFTQALFRAIGLTDQEQRRLHALMATARAMDRA